MSENQILPDDPRLTAYALGELDPTEREAFERLLDESPGARVEVTEIRDLAGALTAEFQREPAPTLTTIQRETILSARLPLPAPRPAQRPRRPGHRILWLASLATMAGIVVVTAMVLPTPNRSREVLVSDFDSKAAFGESSGNLGWELAGQSNPVQSNPVRWNEPTSESLALDSAVPADQPAAASRSGDVAESARRLGRGDTADSYGLAAGVNGAQVYDLGDGESLARRRTSGGMTAGGRGTAAGGRTGVAAPSRLLREENESVQLRDSLAKGHHHMEQLKQMVESGKPGQIPQGTGTPSGRFKVQTGAEPNSSMPDGAVRFATTESESAPLGVPQQDGLGRKAQLSKSTAGGDNGKPEISNSSAASSGHNLFAGRAARTGGFGGGGGGGAAGSEGLLGDQLRSSQLRSFYHQPAQPVAKGLSPATTPAPVAAGAALTPNAPVDQLSDLVESRVQDESGLARGAGRGFGYERAAEERLAGLQAMRKNLPQITALSLGTEAYERIIENPFVSAYEAPLSTFGIDVDTASYANVRRFLTSNQLPPPNAVRIEEMINYFTYDYAQPTDEKPFSVGVEAAACPWNVGHTLVRVGLKGREIPRDKRPASNLVFLVDVSGSMQAENKLPLVKMGLNLLTQQLGENDRVGIVTYSNTAVKRLESTSAANKQAILGVIDSLQAGGSTNGADGIHLAYRAALDHFIAGGTNRVILCTDGDFNVGVSDDDQLVQLIQERARTKVFFSVLGFGMGNLKDGKLEKLADKGNGQYAYIDSQREAQKVFVEDLAGTLVTIAKDVKVQVEFNPNQVGGYRLLGYENRVMAAQDFNNDAKDTGDIGAGHTVTALYEVLPAGALPKPEVGENLRYRKAIVPADGPLASELLTVKLRYKQPEGDASTLIEVPVAKRTIELLDVVKEGDAVACAIELRQIDAHVAANALTALFGADKQDSRAFGADEAGKRLLLRASANEISQVKKLLLEMGEGGSGASRDFNWAAAVAAFAMILRDSQFRGQASFDLVLELAQAANGEDAGGRRQEFIDLVKAAKALVSPAAPVAGASPASVPPLTREQAEAKASVNGKYKNLLRIVEVPEDSPSHGAFNDSGRWDGTSYRGLDNLPQGYWVYVAPNWYIWGDLAK